MLWRRLIIDWKISIFPDNCYGFTCQLFLRAFPFLSIEILFWPEYFPRFPTHLPQWINYCWAIELVFEYVCWMNSKEQQNDWKEMIEIPLLSFLLCASFLFSPERKIWIKWKCSWTLNNGKVYPTETNVALPEFGFNSTQITGQLFYCLGSALMATLRLKGVLWVFFFLYLYQKSCWSR